MSKFTDIAAIDYDFFRMDGRVLLAAEVVETITRRGVNAHAFKALGNKGEPFTLTTFADVTLATQAATIAGYLALQKQFVTVVDDFGRIDVSVMVLGVPNTKAEKIRSPVGGLLGAAGEVLLTQTWRMISAL